MTNKIKNKGQVIYAEDIDIALQMLTRHMNSQQIKPLLTALEDLKTAPHNEAYREQVFNAFEELGFLQGAALTYAPYLNIFVSDDPFAD